MTAGRLSGISSARRSVSIDSWKFSGIPDISRKTSLDSEAMKRSGNDRETLRTGRTAKRIHALLADGRECTATEIAQALGTSRNEVLVAVRAILVDEALQVSR